MSHKFLINSSFHNALETMDHDLAEQERVKGCACGGRLHQSNYPRSPLGTPLEFREYYQARYSYCCAKCRKRTTTPSLRFFGRCWFPEFIHLLISALMNGEVRTLKKLCEKLQELFNIRISAKTCRRWKQWWRDSFTTTKFWQGISGIIPIPYLKGSFPRQIFSMATDRKGSATVGEAPFLSVAPPFARRLIWVLQFFAPLTAGVLRAV